MYKYCIVPGCKSSTKNTPGKDFVNVPRGAQIRKKWCKAIKKYNKKDSKISNNSTRHVCEDHFDMQNDMENYMRYKMVGGNLKVKKGVVPHIKPKCEPSATLQRAKRRERIAVIRKLLENQDEEMEQFVFSNNKGKEKKASNRKPPSHPKNGNCSVNHWSMSDSERSSEWTSPLTASQEIPTSNFNLAPNLLTESELLKPVKTEIENSLEGPSRQSCSNSFDPQDQADKFMTCEIIPAASTTRIKEEPIDVFSSKDVKTSERYEFITPDVPMYEQSDETFPFLMDFHIKQEVLMFEEEN